MFLEQPQISSIHACSKISPLPMGVSSPRFCIQSAVANINQSPGRKLQDPVTLLHLPAGSPQQVAPWKRSGFPWGSSNDSLANCEEFIKFWRNKPEFNGRSLNRKATFLKGWHLVDVMISPSYQASVTFFSSSYRLAGCWGELIGFTPGSFGVMGYTAPKTKMELENNPPLEKEKHLQTNHQFCSFSCYFWGL